MSYEKIFDLVTKVDDFVWGPAMLVLLVGTGIFLTIRVGFLTWKNLGYATPTKCAAFWKLALNSYKIFTKGVYLC